MRQIILHLSTPCQESWAAMKATDDGRHCAACQKTVVDFTDMTDRAIIDYLAQVSQQSVCGRLKPSQLERPLAAGLAAPRWRTWLPALVATISLESLLPARGAAQVGSPPTQIMAIEAQPLTVAQAPESTPTATFRLEGTVVEGKGEPVPGATVRVEGTSAGTATDLAGKFVLHVAPTRAKSFLIISCIGFETVKRRVDFQVPGKPIIIKLKPNPYVLGGLGFTTPPATLWQRFARFFA